MVRFCSVLADAGMVVGSPFIPDLMSLSLTERAVKDTIKSVEVFLDLSEIPDGVKPGLFCISTASILGIHAASDSRIASRIGGLVLFGGLREGEDEATLRDALTELVRGDGETVRCAVEEMPLVPMLRVRFDEHMHAERALDALRQQGRAAALERRIMCRVRQTCPYTFFLRCED